MLKRKTLARFDDLNIAYDIHSSILCMHAYKTGRADRQLDGSHGASY